MQPCSPMMVPIIHFTQVIELPMSQLYWCDIHSRTQMVCPHVYAVNYWKIYAYIISSSLSILKLTTSYFCDLRAELSVFWRIVVNLQPILLHTLSFLITWKNKITAPCKVYDEIIIQPLLLKVPGQKQKILAHLIVATLLRTLLLGNLVHIQVVSCTFLFPLIGQHFVEPFYYNLLQV